MPYTGTKTSVILVQKHKKQKKQPIFLGIAEACGHTMRGRAIKNSNDSIKEDFSVIAENYINAQTDKHLGFYIDNIVDNILVPRYYDPRVIDNIKNMSGKSSVIMTSIKSLLNNKSLAITNIPASVKSEEYIANGAVKFIRTSDINGNEISEHPQKTVSLATLQ